MPSLRLVLKSLLGQEPWLHDPSVHQIPWRDNDEQTVHELIETKSLSFGAMRSDGVITPHPPVQRATDIVVKIIRKLGHQIFEWNAPPHILGNEIANNTWKYDGGIDVQ